MERKIGFTLAEVLITLAIIGVVAAMTIPTLISEYDKKQTVTKLQKATSTISQAFQMASAYQGEPSSWTFVADSGQGSLDLLEKYLFPYLRTSKVCDPEDNSKCFSTNIYRLDGETVQNTIDNKWASFVLADGTSVATRNEEYIDGSVNLPYKHQISFRIDVNGINPPNRAGRDVFCFDMNVYDKYGRIFANSTAISPCFGGVSAREEFTNTDGHCASDKTSHGLGCGALIRLDGWKISDDYPW